MSLKIKEGFRGQKAVVLPKTIWEKCKTDVLLSSLYVTDIGFYPRAKYHFRQRNSGVEQHILIYCVEGKGWANINDVKFTLNAHEYLIIPSGSPHAYGTDESYPWSIYWIHYNGSFSNELNLLLNNDLKRHTKYSPHLEIRTKLFDDIYSTLETGYSRENLLFVSPLLNMLFNTFLFPHKYMNNNSYLPEEEVSIAIEFMRENVEKLLTLENFAKHVNTSVSYFSFLFKRKTGYTPITYFNHLKIQKACQYLQFTDLKLKEISCKFGFEDSYYFSRLFKNHMGVSPLSYRKKKK